MKRLQHVTRKLPPFVPLFGIEELIDWLTEHLSDLIDGAVNIVVGVLGAMKDVLLSILCHITALISYIPYGIVVGINKLIAAVGYLLASAFSLLPDMPFDIEASWAEVPEIDTIFGIVNWAFPVGFLVTALTTLLGLYVTWKIISIGLKWAKAD